MGDTLPRASPVEGRKKGKLPSWEEVSEEIVNLSTPRMASGLVSCTTDNLDTGPSKPHHHPTLP